MDRLYSVLTVKAVQDDQRVIRGIATTPTPDRLGDIVEPLGMTFKNPLPLLWHHDTQASVGEVTLSKPTKDGIEFEAQIKSTDVPGRVKDRLDEAWQSVKLGLVKGVSIGFRSLEREFIKGGGVRFTETECLELSLVSIPANIDATIQQIKAYDVLQSPADAGTRDRPAAAGKPKPPISLAAAPKDAKAMKTTTEQIELFEKRRGDNEKQMLDIQTKCTDENRGKDDAEREIYDRLRDELKSIDLELRDMKELEVINKAKAVVVEKVATPMQATERRNPIIQMRPNVEPGIAMARYVIAKARAHYQHRNPVDVFNSVKEWDNTPEVGLALSGDIEALMNQRAAVGAGTTTDVTWAAPLVAYTQLQSEFIELLRPLLILARIPGITRVPFNIQIPREVTSASVGWVGENAPKPVSKGAFDSITMRWAKAAAIVVLTEELVRFSNPAAEGVVRNQLLKAMAQFLDSQFIDPSKAAVANVSPASITNGVTAQSPTGTTAAALRTDIKTLLAGVLASNLQTAGGVFIMTQQQAVALSLMYTTLGVPQFPGMTNSGGTLAGYPVIASENIPSTSGSPIEGYPLIFLIPSEILLADDGQTIIDISREASVQMDTTPDSPPTASTNMVSFWQMNLVGIRCERWINWQKRRSTAVAYIQKAKYAE